MASISNDGNLVLYFAKGERAIINGMDVVVTVVECGLGGCKLAFEADRQKFKIDREKIYKQKIASGAY